MAQREDVYWNTFLPAFFARVSDIIKNEMTKELKPYGLTSAHGIYIMALTLRDGQTMVGLSQFLDMDASNTNHVIKALRSRGLVYDDRASESSKKFKIYLTEKGRELGLHLMDFQTEYMNGYFNGISNEEIITLRNILLKLLKNIDPDLDNYMLCRYQDP
ncbi:MAG: MarR family winged helix-turn-helix transcriptional regulator, partial [Methanomassiliicoccaceae archaeon]|nr:MarR family winged helix-turn-helix transcriptional regulator [Methanomassiliicoccaceae archaeon]